MSGYEALPARERSVRGVKRRKVKVVNLECDSVSGIPPPPTLAHSYEIFTESEIVSSQPPPIYESASFSSAVRIEDEQPGKVEGSGGMGKWEYLDHTADVQIHTCAFSGGFITLSLLTFFYAHAHAKGLTFYFPLSAPLPPLPVPRGRPFG